MYYQIELKDYVRVPPSAFKSSSEEAILEALNERFKSFVSKDIGIILGVSEITEVREGVIISGDGAAYFDTTFKVIAYKPEMQEILLGKINEITDFGAFISIGALDGMIHVSQTMDDYVSFSKSKVLTGKQSKKSLKQGDDCRARIIAISFKDMKNPKVTLTMRQPWLGNLKWIKDDSKKLQKEKK